MSASATAKYTFDAPAYEPTSSGKKKNHRRVHSNNSLNGGEEGDPLDGSGSLTYSAASSINSAAGESTDSSFADIFRVLDGQDSKELAAVIQKARQKDERSVAAESQHSLAYSTDAESHLRSLATDGESALNGTRYLSVPGQPSDQYSDVGSARVSSLPKDREDNMMNHSEEDLIFAPAEHTDSLKRRKDRKRRERQDKTPRTKNTHKSTTTGSDGPAAAEPSQVERRVESSARVESRQGTPPTARPPKGKETYEKDSEEEDVWYAKWWMFCFPDTVRSMTPKPR